jgi:hypothetical protein
VTDGLAHGGAPDAVLLRRPQFAGQRLAGRESARLDLVAEQVGEPAETARSADDRP